MTYRELADLFVRQQQSAQTARAYRADLDRWFRFLQLDWPPTAEHAVRYREMLESTLSVASAARVFTTARTFHRFCVAQGVLASNPFDGIKPVQRVTNQTPKVPSDVEVERLIAAADIGTRRHAVISLLLNGLRAGEVAGLTEDDMRLMPVIETEMTPLGVRKVERMAWVLRVLGKGRKERLVPMLPEARLSLQWFRNMRSVVSPWLVSEYNGTQLTVRQVEHDVYKAAEYAGIEGMHPHALRHHYATRLIRAGVSVLHVAKLLGHTRADTTQVYVTLDLSDLVAASKLDPRYQPTEDGLRLSAVG